MKQKVGAVALTPCLECLPNKTVERLKIYVHLLDRWRKITNLISDQSFSEVWERHIEDSLYVQRSKSSATRWLDFGTGAGFPGLVIAVVIAERKGAIVNCVESDARKCAFLRTVTHELEIPVKIYNIRAGSASDLRLEGVDAVTARAFASIAQILEFSHTFISRGATAVLPRGRNSFREIEMIDTTRYIVTVRPNPAPRGGAIVLIRQRVSPIAGELSWSGQWLSEQ